jgi:DNA-binding transcriptional LysR family regulator
LQQRLQRSVLLRWLSLSRFRSGQLVPVLTKFLPFEFSIDAYYRHRRHLSAKVRTFIDLIAEQFREGNGCDPARLCTAWAR